MEPTQAIWIKDPVGIFADGAERGVVVKGGKIVELVPAVVRRTFTLRELARLLASAGPLPGSTLAERIEAVPWAVAAVPIARVATAAAAIKRVFFIACAPYLNGSRIGEDAAGRSFTDWHVVV